MRGWRCVALAAVMAAATARGAYRSGGRVGEGSFKGIVHLATGPNDRLYVLDASDRIFVFDGEGKPAGTIDPNMANLKAIAISPKGDLYVFSTTFRERKIKVGARMRMVKVPTGAEVAVFDASGKPLGEKRKIAGVKSVRSACFAGDRLALADLSAKAVVVLDPATWRETARIDSGLRLCCGIFDVCAAPENTIGVSNLGAFRFERYDLTGKKLLEFGRRGRGLDRFHGCCNPVSAAFLPDGRIVTVEKDSTRIKIYEPDGTGAKIIPGVEELVKGCSYVPVAVDSKGTIYLGAVEKGYVVRCVP